MGHGTRYGVRRGLVNLAIAVLAGLAGASAPAAERLRLLVLGDSLTAGLGLARADAFPAQLERALAVRGIAVEVVDGGVSGDTSAGGLARLPWMLVERPDAVIVELGGNDGLRGIDPRTTYANLDRILGRLGEANVPTLLTGMKAPPNLGREYADDFEAVFAGLAQTHGVLFYPFFLEGVAAVPALNQEDAIHPNARGVAAIVERILPLVQDLISRRR